jgi:hypothetical protein
MRAKAKAHPGRSSRKEGPQAGQGQARRQVRQQVRQIEEGKPSKDEMMDTVTAHAKIWTADRRRPPAHVWTALTRGLRGRCPRCGEASCFARS